MTFVRNEVPRTTRACLSRQRSCSLRQRTRLVFVWFSGRKAKRKKRTKRIEQNEKGRSTSGARKAEVRRGGDAERGDEEGEVCVAGRSPFLYGLARGWFGPPLHNRRVRLSAPRPRPPCWYRSVRQPWFKIFTVKVPRSSIDGYAMPCRASWNVSFVSRVSRSRR